MPNNPLTQEELYDYGILRSITPPNEVVGALSPPYFPPGYFLVPPHDVNGIVAWRKFHAGYISEGLIDPDRLGTDAVGDGDLYLADDGTWKAVSGGGAVTSIIAGSNISISPTSGIGDVTITASNVLTDPTGYGSFYSNQSQSLGAIDTPQVVTFNSTYEANDVYISSNRIYFNKAGTYQFAYVAQIFNTSNDIQHCSFWIKYNGNNFPNSATHITVNARKSSTEPSEQQMKLILSGTAQNDGDYIELYWQGTSTNLSLGYVASGPGEAPVNAPSVIANIIPIGAQGRDSNLNELNDVAIVSPTTNQLLKYNGTVWENWTPNFLTSVPTLDQVTTAGNATLNQISVGSLLINTNIDAGYKLDVNGTARISNTLTVIGEGTGTAQIGSAAFGGTNGYTAISLNGSLNSSNYNLLSSVVDKNLYINRPTGADISFRINNSSQMIITSGGNVGIGTSNPFERLHVVGNIIGTGNISINPGQKLQLSGSGDATHHIYHSSTSDFDIINYSTGFKFENYLLGDQITLHGITGNFIIGGTVDAGYKLDVNGTARISSTLTANSFVKSGGTSSQFLKADGSVDSSTYLTSFTETDPTVPSHVKSITTTQISNWNTAYGWGNHASIGYLTSFTESDPTVPSHVKSIVTTDITNWNNAFSWGDHSIQGYLTGTTGFTGTFTVPTNPPGQQNLQIQDGLIVSVF